MISNKHRFALLIAYAALFIVFPINSFSQTFRSDTFLREEDPDSGVVIEVNGQRIDSAISKLMEVPRIAINFLGRLKYKWLAREKDKKEDWFSSTSVSLEEMVKDKSFLKSAWVSYDEQRQIWKAKWTKPTMLNYPMLLKPAIAQTFHPGDWLAFESAGENGYIAKKKDELVVIRDGKTVPLGSQDLAKLLVNKILVDGISLSIDQSGNLILEATGAKAQQMAKIKT